MTKKEQKSWNLYLLDFKMSFLAMQDTVAFSYTPRYGLNCVPPHPQNSYVEVQLLVPQMRLHLAVESLKW